MGATGSYRALAEFRYQIRRFLNFSERVVRRKRLEPQQYQALLALKGLPPGSRATIGVLAERLQIQHHSTVELVNRLEARRLVRRSRNPFDRREVLLRLTRRGESLLGQLARANREELRSVGPKLLRALSVVLETGENSASLARRISSAGQNRAALRLQRRHHQAR